MAYLMGYDTHGVSWATHGLPMGYSWVAWGTHGLQARYPRDTHDHRLRMGYL